MRCANLTQTLNGILDLVAAPLFSNLDHRPYAIHWHPRVANDTISISAANKQRLDFDDVHADSSKDDRMVSQGTSSLQYFLGFCTKAR